MAEAIAGEIGPERHRMLNEHLSRCGNCSAEYAALSKTLDLVTKKAVPEPAEQEWRAFRSNLRRAIGASRQPEAAAAELKPRLWRRRLAPALVLTAIVVVVAIVATYNLHPPQSPVDSEEAAIDRFVEKALIYDYLVQQLELEEVYLSEDDLYDLDEQLEEIEWLL